VKQAVEVLVLRFYCNCVCIKIFTLKILEAMRNLQLKISIVVLLLSNRHVV